MTTTNVTDPPRQPPSLARQAWNLARRLANFVADGCRTVSELESRSLQGLQPQHAGRRALPVPAPWSVRRESKKTPKWPTCCY